MMSVFKCPVYIVGCRGETQLGGLVKVGPTKIISQFCQIVKDCYGNVDRLFQDDEKLPYLH